MTTIFIRLTMIVNFGQRAGVAMSCTYVGLSDTDRSLIHLLEA
jgi:hypothetical protein